MSRELGVTPAAVYRHFRDKDELLDALAITGFIELREALRDSASRAGSGKDLQALVTAYLSFARQNPSLMTLMFQQRILGGGTRARLAEATGECLAEFVAAAARGSKGADPEGSIRQAVQAWCAAHGFATLRQVNAFGALDQWMLPTPAELVSPGARRRD